MAQLVVRNLDDDIKAKLRQRARRHGHSTEEEVRAILRHAVSTEDALPRPLGTRLKSRFAGIGFDEDIVEWRGHPAQPAEIAS